MEISSTSPKIWMRYEEMFVTLDLLTVEDLWQQINQTFPIIIRN